MPVKDLLRVQEALKWLECWLLKVPPSQARSWHLLQSNPLRHRYTQCLAISCIVRHCGGQTTKSYIHHFVCSNVDALQLLQDSLPLQSLQVTYLHHCTRSLSGVKFCKIRDETLTGFKTLLDKGTKSKWMPDVDGPQLEFPMTSPPHLFCIC